jgi:lipocalin
MEEIYKEIFSLKIFPNRCPQFNEKYRVLTINKRYRVFFIVSEENQKVIISRIFASFENYENTLENY